MKCPCDSTSDYDACCGPFISGEKHPTTPEQLMRSRYTAYSLSNTHYIKNTMQGKAALGFDEEQARHWSQRIIWIKLQVIQTSLQDKNSGQVEFIASFVEHGKLKTIHEKSEFHRLDKHWFYVNGQPQQPSQNKTVSRNTSCPCGKPNKFKNCHGKNHAVNE